MKKLLFIFIATILLSCTTEETVQTDLNCYNSDLSYPQISLLEIWQGEFYRHDNGVEILPRVVNTANSITVYLENGEVRTYCKALQMAQPYHEGDNEPFENHLQLTPTEYFSITNDYFISIHNSEGVIISYPFAKR